MRIKDRMNGVLAEKAGLKTRLGSKGNRTGFPSRGTEIVNWPQSAQQCGRQVQDSGRVAGRTLRGACGQAGGAQQDQLHALSPSSQGKQERRVSALWGGGPLSCRNHEEWSTQASLPTDC